MALSYALAVLVFGGFGIITLGFIAAVCCGWMDGE